MSPTKRFMPFFPIKTAVFDIWGLWLLLPVAAFLNCGLALGIDGQGSPSQVEYRNDKLNILLSYSSELVEVPSGRVEAPLSLVQKTGSYPTFNIVALPGNLTLAADLKPSPVEQVLDGYKRLGLSDAKVTHSHYHDLLKEIGLTVEIEYSDKGRELVSSVTVANGISNHFFFTFIAPKSEFESNRALRNEIIQSIRFLRPPLPMRDLWENVAADWLSFALVGMAVLIVLFIRYLKVSFRSKS